MSASPGGGGCADTRRLKQRIVARLDDMPRHLRALRAAQSAFGEDFDRDAFIAAATSSEPDPLNQVHAVERGLDLLDNYLVELTYFGLQLAGLREADEPANSPRDLRRLRDAGVIGRAQADRLIEVVRTRADMVHEYAELDAAKTHRAVEVLVAELPSFARAYVTWVKAGFPASPRD